MTDSKQESGFKRTLRRMLNTPPKAHEPSGRRVKSTRKKKGGAYSTASKTSRPRA